MKQDDAKNYIISDFCNLPEKERTETKAVEMAFKYSAPDSKYHFKYSGDNYQVIIGWLTPYVLKKK